MVWVLHFTTIYAGEFSNLKYTTICEWRKAITSQHKKVRESVTELHGKKQGKPPMSPEEVTTCVMKYIHAVSEAGGLIK